MPLLNRNVAFNSCPPTLKKKKKKGNFSGIEFKM